MLVMSTLEHIALHTEIYLYSFLAALLLLSIINYMYFREIYSGLINFQMSFVFNFSIIFYGYYFNLLPFERSMHFIFYELIVTVGIYTIYIKTITSRKIIFSKLFEAPIVKITIIIIVFNLCLMCMYYVFVPSAGEGSRIEFMTSRWFSFVRPIDFILQPLGYFLVVYFYDHGKKLLPSLLLVSLVLPNIASGSKASFVIAILSAFLIYKQLKGSKIVISNKLKILMIMFVVYAVKSSLDRLRVGLLDLALRFIRTGEATIIVYFSDNPTEACRDTSMFAALHRGVAKLFRDPSALDVDTLFGFALSIIDYGGHNFTGPNSQISSYMMCNFPGWYNVVGVLAIVTFFSIIWIFFKLIIINNKSSLTILLLPFMLAAISGYAQSYDFGVSSLTVIFMICIISSYMRFLYVATRARRTNNNISN